MAGLNPESLIWLDHIETLRAQPASAKRVDLQKAVNRPNSQISVLLTLKECLNPEDIESIQQTAKNTPPYTLSYRSAQALAGLKGKVWDLDGAFHAALEMTLSLRLSTMQIKALVEWIADEKPLEDFDPKKVKPVRLATLTQGKPAQLSSKKGAGNDLEETETTEDEEENGGITWKEMYDQAKKTSSGWSFLAMEIFVYAMVGGIFWLIWKAIYWLIHLL